MVEPRRAAGRHQAIAHPTADTLTFDIGLLRAKTKPDITVALYFPVPDSGTEERLREAMSALSTP